MPAFRTGCGRAIFSKIAIAQLALEEIYRHAHAEPREHRIVTRSLVADKGVRAVEFVPGKVQIEFAHALVDDCAAFRRNMRILLAPDHHHLTFDIAGTFERIILHAEAQTALVNVRGVETDAGQHLGIHRRAETEMAADADAECADLPRAMLVLLQKSDHNASVIVVGLDRLIDLIIVAFVRAGLIVAQDRSDLLELVKDLRYDNNKSMAGEHRGGALDRSGLLEDLRKEHNARIPSRCDRSVDVAAHCAGGGFEIDLFIL